MALIIPNYEMPDKSIVNNAYIAVQSVLIQKSDNELLEPIDGTDDLKVTWVTQINAAAAIYVWADEGCRQNRVSPIHWFSIEFPYQSTDVFADAYSKLKTLFVDAVSV